jgi:CheY-like chemotaxis protein/anti-sigma regulatory factor (Ser/Thr protein kinase)
MATILVVDDNAVDRQLIGSLVEEHDGWTAAYAADGREALAHIRHQPPDVVLTDLQMPEMNGLELVEVSRREHPGVPVILMTAYGSEDIAIAALRKGAASYVAKRNLARDLVATIESVLPVAAVRGDDRRPQGGQESAEFTFVLGNDTTALQPVIGHLLEHMAQWRLVDEGDSIRVGLALYEVLMNAVEHGNLELDSQLRDIDDGIPYRELAEERRRRSPYQDRTVRLSARFSRDEAAFVVRDQGPGYDPDALPDPTDPVNMVRAHGRGLLLIRTFMDDVRLNDKGNEVTLVKRRA